MSKTGAISQKEYLQKYLSGNKKNPTKKKKRQKIIGNGIKIIDDDLDLTKMRSLDDNEIDMLMQGEDAPVVVGIVDERADEVKTLESYKQTNKWKLMTQDDGIESSIKIEQISKRKNNRDEDSDLSPPRRKSDDDSDLSPERNAKRIDESPPRRKKIQTRRQGSDSDISPPRRTAKKIDESPPRRKEVQNRRRDSDSDISPPRRTAKRIDESPPRRKEVQNRRRDSDSDIRQKVPTRRRGSDSDLSPPRKEYKREDRREDKPKEERRRKSRWGDGDGDSRSSPNRSERRHRESSRTDEKMQKTLDGKRAGLQDARQLKDENEDFRRREDELFGKLSEDVSGRNAAAIKRNIKGKKPTEQEIAEQKEKEERQKILDAKYSRWGKGVKQTEAHESRVKDFLHESSKPLARYKDDTDLDRQLRQVERLDDPMLEYMRKKSKPSGPNANAEVYPAYQGPYPANRFNIRPGYRWDGVDRSNGYEKKYFETKSAKVANEAEAYKWSTEDM